VSDDMASNMPSGRATTDANVLLSMCLFHQNRHVSLDRTRRIRTPTHRNCSLVYSLIHSGSVCVCVYSSDLAANSGGSEA